MAQWCTTCPRAGQGRSELGADLQRTNDFAYAEKDPYGYACPLGSHIRRMNPTGHSNEHEATQDDPARSTYGPPLPEGAPEDGKERASLRLLDARA